MGAPYQELLQKPNIIEADVVPTTVSHNLTHKLNKILESKLN
ncbi:hypothetical protein LEP1GSC035_3007 [Leptospira noguchii str. 2007001578]|uniref:Uncharacterized protein n=1 Tax=Leptospira noguchii str. 2007001578 TaxID=1049974 RepID=A0ABP2T511_9LEPT|nr:hypothetical protein LEP1GSC035_3007 [Leptospira noguchii str. 2007001578]